MAFQPEIPNYDTGVYQLELADPVQGGVGGVSNEPLLNLANRTAWLYQELNLVMSGGFIPSTVAPLLSPNFSGSPTVPTPALGDSSLKISNTAFVQGTIAGVLSLSVAGGANVVLTAVQAGSGTLNFTGAITANIAVIVPNTPGKWVVENNTTGGFTLTVKTAAGTGIAVSQGKNQSVFGDGTNVYLASNDFSSLQLTGTPTTPTPALGDNSLKIANTAWVQSTISGVLSLSVAGGTNISLTAVQAGNGTLSFTGALTANIAVIVPNTSGKWIVENNTTGPFTLTIRTASDAGLAVSQGKRSSIFCDGANVALASNDFSNIALTGVPTAPTAAAGTNTTQVSTTAFVTGAVATAGANYALLAGSSTQVFSVGPATIGTEAVQLQQVGHGQCRFYFSSATVVTLKPYNGNNLIINGVPQQVPSAGVTLSNAGLTASTVYYVYASMAGSVMTLSTSTTGHSTAPNGIETLSTDVTKTLVGMVLPNASAQFQMSGQYLGVLNWFQRQSVECHVPQPGTPITTSSTTYVELSASYVITFLTWGVADMRSSGFVTNSAPATSALLVGIDSSTTGSAPSAWATTTGGLSGAACTSARFTLAEGGHFALLAGKITTGTASFTPDLEVIVEG